MITLEIDPSTFDGDNNPPEVRVDDICIVNPEGNWHLYNHGHLELTKNCDEQYLSFWESPTYAIKDLLVVGGGDLQVASKFIEEYENNSENGRMVSCDDSGDSNDMGNNFRCY